MIVKFSVLNRLLHLFKDFGVRGCLYACNYFQTKTDILLRKEMNSVHLERSMDRNRKFSLFSALLNK